MVKYISLKFVYNSYSSGKILKEAGHKIDQKDKRRHGKYRQSQGYC
jgi:hypothetical protein